MPFPNEHAARLIDPSKFQEGSFRRKEIKNGISVIVGRLKGQETMTTQSYRFDKAIFTAEEAKAWLKENDISPLIFEQASKQTQSFKSQVILFEKKIQSFSQNDILSKLPKNVLDEIKIKDKHPFFQVYSLCHEGTNNPTIIGEESRPITWTKKAIQSIKNIITKGIKLFKGHNEDNSTINRKPIGEIVHDFQEEINGKLHHLIVTYHSPENREEAKKYDICSQEADWNFFEEAGKLFASTIEKLTGVAVENGANEKPAFSGARRLAFVQAFENKIKKIEGDSIMSDVISSGELQQQKKGQRSFKDWLEEREKFAVYPRQLFKLEDLKADREFGKYFEELEKLRDENKLLKDQIEKLQTNSKAEISKLTRKIYIGSAKERLSKIMETYNYPDKMRRFLEKAFNTNKEKIDDLTNEGLEKWTKLQTETFQNVMSLVDEEPPAGTESTETKPEVDDKADIGKAANNPFLEEDIDEELEFFDMED